MNPLDSMIFAAVKCLVCGAGYGACDCWVKCGCGRSYQKNTAYENPVHTEERQATDKEYKTAKGE